MSFCLCLAFTVCIIGFNWGLVVTLVFFMGLTGVPEGDRWGGFLEGGCPGGGAPEGERFGGFLDNRKDSIFIFWEFSP